MIDRKARNKLAELLRSLSAGLITNDEFEDSIPESSDEAVKEIFASGGSFLYSDMKEYKLKGKDALEPLVKKEVAKWVLFLKSNLEYSWPNAPIFQRFLHTISFGFLGASYKKVWAATGQLEAWPFLTISQLNNAKNEFGYLGKKYT